VNRIDRISAILIHLQSRRIVKASELAERFNISLRTVYRDIRTLEEAGVPLAGEAGIGYSIVKGYHLPPVVFTEDEAIALLTSHKLASELTDDLTEKSGSSAMYKIRSVLESLNKEKIHELDSKMKVLRNPNIPKNNFNSPLNLITKAVLNKNKLTIRYTSNHSLEENTRTIEPIGIWFLGGRWHLMAYCELRKDYRNFRLDRMQDIQILKEHFKTIHPELNQLIAQNIKENNLTEVLIRIGKKSYKHVGDQKYFMGFTTQKELKDSIEMSFLSASLEGMSRWLMLFGNDVEIIKPLDLKHKIKKMAELLLEKYKDC
jgi:predicted DNA-binding transcriptional regulator YafY